jgi:hypothetical protein
MNFRAHSIAECRVHQLMLLHLVFSGELEANDHCLEVLAIVAQHLHVVARHAIHDVILQFMGCQHLVLLRG